MRYDQGISWTTKDMFQGREIKDGHGQESNIKRKDDGSKFLNMRSTQVGGSKLMNIDCLHLICAYSCACLHCISSKFNMHACVVYASYRT